MAERTIFDDFALFRGYVDREDALINSRLLWNINIQGFLFGTYGYSLQKLADLQAAGHANTNGGYILYGLVLLLPIVGMCIGFLSLMGVKAAQMAISNLNTQWNWVAANYNRDDRLRVPKLIGGGCPPEDPDGQDAKTANNWGLIAPLGFPMLFFGVWAILLVVYGYLLVMDPFPPWHH